MNALQGKAVLDFSHSALSYVDQILPISASSLTSTLRLEVQALYLGNDGSYFLICSLM